MGTGMHWLQRVIAVVVVSAAIAGLMSEPLQPSRLIGAAGSPAGHVSPRPAAIGDGEGAVSSTALNAGRGGLAIEFAPPQKPLPANSQAPYRLVVRNHSDEAISVGSIALEFDEGSFRRWDATPTPSRIDFNLPAYRRTYVWAGSRLGPGEARTVEVSLAAIPSPYLEPTKLCGRVVAAGAEAGECWTLDISSDFSASSRWTANGRAVAYQLNDRGRPESVTREQFAATVAEAAGAWAASGVVRFEFRGWTDRSPSDPPAGVLVVGWSDLPRGVLAQANFPCGCPSGAGLWLNEAIDTTMLLHVIEHEIGHVLGLPHTATGASLMFPTAQPSLLRPSPTDLAALRRLYGATP
jgi:hypothetical protein